MGTTSTQGAGGSSVTPSPSVESADAQRDIGPRSEPRYWNALAWVMQREDAGPSGSDETRRVSSPDPGTRSS